MIQNRKQGLIFALITVIITVPCFVFYCLSIENGGILNVDWKFALILIPIEFVLAYLSEVFIGSPLALKFAMKAIDPKKNDHMIVESAIISATVTIMCPWMSFLATILYKGIFPALVFHDAAWTFSSFIVHFIPNFLQTVVLNFPFAFFGQMFIIQPVVRRIFKLLFYRKKSPVK